MMAVVNSGMAVAGSFGAAITTAQVAAVIGLTNAVLVAGLYLARLKERNGRKETTP